MFRQSAVRQSKTLLDEILGRRRVPLATYRLQFSRSFTFRDARRLVPYLAALGISDVYASPVLKAGREHDHGYDIVDHTVLDPVLGSAEDFDALVEELHARGMGLIFDIVPNHMGIEGRDNVWWMDVLENGPGSPYARFFDIDWQPLKAGSDLENRVLLPILRDPYGKVLENQEISLSFEDGAFFVSYHDQRMPVAPRSYGEILSARLGQLVELLGPDHDHVMELRSIITAISYLPLETDTEPDKVAERQREKEIIKRRIADLAARSPDVRELIELTVREYNGIRGDPRSFDLLESLLDNQSYRLSFWRVAAEEINYRRFFDVNGLAAIRMEQPGVFEETHRLVLRLLREGKVTGLRIDHADGLLDPAGYLRQLQRAALEALCQPVLDARFGSAGPTRSAVERRLLDEFETRRARDPNGPAARPLYVVVEKILSPGEDLPATWPVDGTTGYDAANLINGVFVDSANGKAFSSLYAAFTHLAPVPFADLINSTKKIIMLVSLASEINELGFQLKRIARKNRWYRDFTVNSLTHAVREVIAGLPVYRTYLTEGGERIEAHDLAAIEAAVAEARQRNPRTAAAVFDFVRRVLLQQYPGGASEKDRLEWDSFVLRFQQTSGPVMAKGVEDTAFYVYNRLLSLNEVGGDPAQFGVSPAVFHRQNAQRAASWPCSLVAGSTHDSKRSADVRARLNVLSEIPQLWRAAVVRWSRQNRRYKTIVSGQPAPDRNDEYLLYQTLVGTWPLQPLDDEGYQVFCQRIQDYMQKAIKEAKVHTSWVNPNQAYDEAVARFVGNVLGGPPDAGFLADFRAFQEFVARYGMLNALAQTLLQLTVPGVPDLYQGNELWDFRLVDPDNRRPIDYAPRVAMLDEIRRRGRDEGLAAELLGHWRDGGVKLFLIHRVLKERKACPDVFVGGAYRPLEVIGEHRDHVLAFARCFGVNSLVTVVPRLVVSLTRGTWRLPLGPETWSDTALVLRDAPPGVAFRNVLTGELVRVEPRPGDVVVQLSDVLSTFPVALLRKTVNDTH